MEITEDMLALFKRVSKEDHFADVTLRAHGTGQRDRNPVYSWNFSWKDRILDSHQWHVPDWSTWDTAAFRCMDYSTNKYPNIYGAIDYEFFSHIVRLLKVGDRMEMEVHCDDKSDHTKCRILRDLPSGKRKIVYFGIVSVDKMRGERPAA